MRLILLFLILVICVSSAYAINTNISFSPSTPNGNNGWFVIEPIITLTGNSSGITYFRFGNNPWITYTNSFNRTNTINGIQDLFYFTNFSNSSEDVQKYTLYVDINKPSISNLKPINNGFSGTNGKISAVISDVFLRNSGINISSIKMFLDNNSINFTTFITNNLYVSVNSDYSNLENGLHNLAISVLDNAGNNASITWNFNVDTNNINQLNIYSPSDLTYNSKFLTNLSISEKVKIYLHDSFDNRIRLLCSNCDKYSNFLNFQDGEHEVKFIASDNASNNISKEIRFFIDTVKPIIIGVNLKNNTVSNSSFFSVKYSEKFLQGVYFYYTEKDSNNLNVMSLNNCKNGTKMECNLNLDKNELDGKNFVYYFEVKDNLRSVFSKKQEVTFDFTKPNLNILNPVYTIYITTKVRFDVISNEKLKSLSYIENRKEIPLCTNCIFINKTVPFTNGSHSITIKAVDLAGNSNLFEKSFEIRR